MPCHLVDDRQEKGYRRPETSSAKTTAGREGSEMEQRWDEGGRVGAGKLVPP